MKVNAKTKNSTYFFTCTAGHLKSSFVPTMGHLPVCFQKIPMPGGRPGGGDGHCWDLVWPDLALIRMKVSAKTKNSTDVFTCIAGYLGGWAQLEMIDA